MLWRKTLTAIASVAFSFTGSGIAATTTWTNPDGGAWTDPSNWSSGVPTNADTAVLPPLDADGYSVALPTGAQAEELRVGGVSPGGAVQLTGGSLAVSIGLSVGIGGEQGDLTLSNVAAQAGSVVVGASSGSGALRLSGTTTLVAATVACAQGGVGTLEVESGAVLLPAVSLNLFADATLKLWAKPGAAPRVLAGTVARGGHLVVLATPELVLPTSAILLLNSSGIMTGSFASVTGPIVQGYEVGVTVTIQWVALNGLDPVVAIDVTFPNGTIYGGFSQPLDVVGIRYSGATTDLCLCCSCPGVAFTSSNPELVYVTGKTLHVDTVEPATLTATHVESGVVVSKTVDIVPSTEYPVTYQRVATTADGEPANNSSLTLPGPAAWTPDGRLVVFASWATNLVEPDPEPDDPNIYLKDTQSGTVEQIDVGAAFGAPFYNWSSEIDISADGRFVVFVRRAAGLPHNQMWIRDRWKGATSLLSKASDGTPADDACSNPRINPSGDLVVFTTKATNLVPGLDGSHSQILSWQAVDGSLTVVSAASDGTLANGTCLRPSLADDGALIAFETSATNLVTDNSGIYKIVLWDREAGTFSRLDVSSSGLGADKSSAMADLSADGRFAVFASQATNLGGDSDGSAYDIFVRDRLSGTTTFLSPFIPGSPGSTGYAWPSSSDDGEFVAFIAFAGDGYDDGVQLRRVNRATLAYDIVAVNPWGEMHQVWKTAPQLSPDGSRVLFAAEEADLVPFGSTIQSSTFVRDFAPSLAADLNHDGHVNSADLAVLLGAWGTTGPADLDGDGVVGASDLATLLGSWTG